MFVDRDEIEQMIFDYIKISFPTDVFRLSETMMKEAAKGATALVPDGVAAAFLHAKSQGASLLLKAKLRPGYVKIPPASAVTVLLLGVKNADPETKIALTLAGFKEDQNEDYFRLVMFR